VELPDTDHLHVDILLHVSKVKVAVAGDEGPAADPRPGEWHRFVADRDPAALALQVQEEADIVVVEVDIASEQEPVALEQELEPEVLVVVVPSAAVVEHSL
jgi:hypothetical protein